MVTNFSHERSKSVVYEDRGGKRLRNIGDHLTAWRSQTVSKPQGQFVNTVIQDQSEILPSTCMNFINLCIHKQSDVTEFSYSIIMPTPGFNLKHHVSLSARAQQSSLQAVILSITHRYHPEHNNVHCTL